jgi:hypothetical protein
MINGDIDFVNVDEVDFKPKLMTKHKFQNLLSKMTSVRQDCVNFALEMDWSIEQAIQFQRKDIERHLPYMNEKCVEIVKRQPISLFNKSVFWEQVFDQPRMLVSMRQQVIQLFCMPWSDMLRQYDADSSSLPSIYPHNW